MARWYEQMRQAVLVQYVEQPYKMCDDFGMDQWYEPPRITSECGRRFFVTTRSFERFRCQVGDLVILECPRLSRLFRVEPQDCQWVIVGEK